MNELKWRDDCYCLETLFGVAVVMAALVAITAITTVFAYFVSNVR